MILLEVWVSGGIILNALYEKLFIINTLKKSAYNMHAS